MTVLTVLTHVAGMTEAGTVETVDVEARGEATITPAPETIIARTEASPLTQYRSMSLPTPDIKGKIMTLTTIKRRTLPPSIIKVNTNTRTLSQSTTITHSLASARRAKAQLYWETGLGISICATVLRKNYS